jgi:hypothetical protein
MIVSDDDEAEEEEEEEEDENIEDEVQDEKMCVQPPKLGKRPHFIVEIK